MVTFEGGYFRGGYFRRGCYFRGDGYFRDSSVFKKVDTFDGVAIVRVQLLSRLWYHIYDAYLTTYNLLCIYIQQILFAFLCLNYIIQLV